MPWKEFKIMDQREHFAFDWLTGDYPKRALCAAYGISRPTGDKWLTRSHSQGVAGLADLARRCSIGSGFNVPSRSTNTAACFPVTPEIHSYSHGAPLRTPCV